MDVGKPIDEDKPTDERKPTTPTELNDRRLNTPTEEGNPAENDDADEAASPSLWMDNNNACTIVLR